MSDSVTQVTQVTLVSATFLGKTFFAYLPKPNVTNVITSLERQETIRGADE